MHQVPLPTLNTLQETQQTSLCHNSNTTLTTTTPSLGYPYNLRWHLPPDFAEVQHPGHHQQNQSLGVFQPPKPYLSALSRAVLLVPRFQWHRGSWRWPGRSWQPSDGCAAGSSPRTRSLKGWLPRKSNFLNSLETALERLEMASRQVCCSPRGEDGIGNAEMHQL